ncbi:hypothetical protein IMCC3317_17000 [Kordia antarctica]|uniref:Uncharacterized protein n=1 Tax=Kordia antarctica TaxID=1218801 RepID=A0A7L4ZHY1_9FLAO|nr:hypothetical protein [Kordia antarctica]QHI36338.1 hypothetical protein IMCC3317_17000 [Kordia antarctica]
MKKQSLKNVLRLKRATIVSFVNRQTINGGIKNETGESCVDVCETRENLECSWGAK